MKNQEKSYNSKLAAQSSQLDAAYGKLPPQAIDVEEAVLGALMLERDAIFKVSPIIYTEDFYKEEHQKIFDTISELSSQSHSIDLLTVTQRLKDKEILDMVGGPGYITKLTSRVSAATNIEQHARIIRDKSFLRLCVEVGNKLTAGGYGDNIDEAELLWTVLSQIIDSKLAGTSRMMHIRDILKLTTSKIMEEQRKVLAGETAGITTGLADLDRLNNGWQPGDLIIIAARPSMGKTAIALNLFTKAPAIQGKKICMFSLEMENLKLSERLIISYGGIERDNLKSRKMTEGDWKAYNNALHELEQLPIYIDDTPGMTVKKMDALVREKVRKKECDLVVIDYLQLVESPSGYGNKNREREVAEISRGLKKMAKASEVPVILLAQLNRALENRDDKKPRLADLRESGAIEQDADIVIFPWRPCYYDADATDSVGTSLQNVMFLEVAKYREGRVGTILAKHNEDLTQFFDYNTYNMQEPINPNSWMNE